MEAGENDACLLLFRESYDFSKIKIEGQDYSILGNGFIKNFPIALALI